MLKLINFFTNNNKININTKYSPQLDHVRAVAAFMVFTWHFIHFNNFHRVTPDILLFPLSILTEGHSGVVLFMTLSGYLFSKIFENKQINLKYFYLNRILRLIPLLVIIILVNHVLSNELNFLFFIKKFLKGFFQNWDYGAWSVSVEFKYYYLLPLILFFLNKNKKYLFLIIFFSVILNFFMFLIIEKKININIFTFLKERSFQHYSYYSIIGHLNEFLFGMLSYKYRNYIKSCKNELIFVSIIFLIFYYNFERNGGFYDSPKDSKIWIILPSVQGFFYAFVISFYDNNNFNFLKTKKSFFLAKIGLFSYSIYLWHFIFVFRIPEFINDQITKLNTLYLTLFFSIPCFALIVLLGGMSYYIFEKPWLKLRKKYAF
jgi:peptidoglycan/LPS O-acetylase OafA/YrhL